MHKTNSYTPSAVVYIGSCAFVLLVLLISGCKQKTEVAFHLPYIADLPPDTFKNKYDIIDSMYPNSNIYIGYYPLQDTIKLSEADHGNNAFDAFSMGYNNIEDLKVYIDSSVTLRFASNVPFYPMYIVNTSGETARIWTDYILFEAEYKPGDWRPIESVMPSMCGHISTLKIPACTQFMFGIVKYEGKERHRLRVCVSGPGGEIRSAPFYGYINPGQFIERKQWY